MKALYSEFPSDLGYFTFSRSCPQGSLWWNS